jgi:hypothetical protein
MVNAVLRYVCDAESASVDDASLCAASSAELRWLFLHDHARRQAHAITRLHRTCEASSARAKNY